MACDLLVVGAHPDDAELGVGGIIAVTVAAGGTVVIVDVTAGELASEVRVRDREDDAARAAEVLGVRRQCLGLPDRGLLLTGEALVKCVEAVRRWRPEVILLPDPDDRHPDHGRAWELFREAVFSAGLTRVGDAEPHRPRRTYTYGVTPGLPPAAVMDVSEGYAKKLAALNCYRHLGDVRWPETSSGQVALIQARDRYYGELIGSTHGEAVRACGPIVLTTL